MSFLMITPSQLAHRVILINATAFVRYAWASIGFFFASDTFSKIVVRTTTWQRSMTCYNTLHRNSKWAQQILHDVP